jgi:hypothetical protein
MKEVSSEYMEKLKEESKKYLRKICCAKCISLKGNEHYNPHDFYQCKLLECELDDVIPDIYDYVCDSFDNGDISKEITNFRKITNPKE